MSKLKQYHAFLLILFISALGGGVSVLAKIGLKDNSPLNFTFWRFLSSLIVLLPIFFIQKQKFTFQAMRKLFWVILFASGNIFIFIFGIRFTSASASQVIYTFSPLLAGIFSYFLLGDKIGARKIAGILLGLLGTLLIILLPVFTHNTGISGGLLGNLLILLAVLSHSIYSVLSKNKQENFSPISITTYSACFILVISLILIPIGDGTFVKLPPVGSIFSIAYTGIAGTALFYFLYQYAIKISSPLAASTVLYLEPIFTFIWAILLIGERLTIGLIGGMVLVLMGVYLAIEQKKEKISNNLN